MNDTYRRRLERAKTPEEAGVSSSAIAAFIADLKKSRIETHSIMVLRRGKVAFETWAEPYAPDIPHAMYSVSKSFASIAVGFAVEEGFLSLETRILDIFPEFEPEKPDENLEKLTVFHLLTMTAGKDMSVLTDRTKNRWIQDFFDSKWKFAPGESWHYVNENIFMLCAALTRLTGMSVREYLTPRLFEPLGYGRVPYWESDPNGVAAGGWGLFITTEELAKVSLCLLQGGVFDGKQVIPEQWVREATKKQAQNNRDSQDSSSGYGFCFWRNSCPDSYRLDGMFSQFGMVFEKEEAVLVITASEIKEQKYRDCIWRHFPQAFIESDESEKTAVLPGVSLVLEPLKDLAAAPRSPYEKIIIGRTLMLGRQRLLEVANMPLSMLPAAIVYMSAEKAGGINHIRFEFAENECAVSWDEKGESNTVICGMDGKARLSKIHLAGMDFTASCTAAWKTEKTLSFWMRPLESVCQRRVDFVFDGYDAALYFSSWPDTKNMLKFMSENVKEYVKNPVAIKTAQKIMTQAHKIVEPSVKGRFGTKTEE
jgi:CubicO group peptidase (beta-lactamase class C family)